MPRTMVEFRGEMRSVEYKANAEPDVNAYEMDWHFVDLDTEAHQVLNITEQEDDAICAALWEHYYDWCSAQDYD